jgi:hypothetical protein
MAPRSREGLKLNPFFHLFSLLLSLIACFLLFYTLLNNVPLSLSSSNPNQRAIARPGGAWLITVNETLSSTNDGNSGELRAWRFGVWGWCEQSLETEDENARCTLKALWKLPGSTTADDSVLSLDLGR